MQRSNWKLLILFIAISLYTLLCSVLFINDLINVYDLYINPIAWLIFFGYSIYLTKGNAFRFRARNDKLRTLFIIIIFYICIYVLSGFILGFTKSIYNHSFLGILLNIWSFILVCVFKEYSRYALLNGEKKSKLMFILVTILFVFADLSFANISSYFVSGEIAFKYLCGSVLTSIITSIILSYLARTSGYLSLLIYRLPLLFFNYLFPVLPNIDWMFEVIFDSGLAVVVYLYISYIERQKEARRESRKFLRKSEPIRYIPPIIIIALIVCFVGGFFKYVPVAIMSNSMLPEISRGDAVIVEKIDDVLSIKKGDVIEYELEGTVVVHRVVEILEQKRGHYTFLTKGDNNNLIDAKPVSEEQIKGIVKAKIPYLGYPSVLLSDYLNKSEAKVETGNE